MPVQRFEQQQFGQKALWRNGLAGGVALVWALVLVAAPAKAKERDTSEATAEATGDTATGPLIVVTGRGLSAGPATPAYDVQKIDRDAILAAASGRIEDVLSGVAGFQQFRRSDSRSANPSSQGVTLRALGGNATSRTLVLLDGVPMADPMFGSVPLSAIAPERLGAIRVMRGGGSGAFGAGAVAGTIELESADAQTLGPASGEVTANDRGETSLSAGIAPRLGSGFAEVSGRWDRGQGFWTTPVDQRGPASVRAAYDSWSGAIRGAAPVNSEIEIQARGLIFGDHRTLRFAGANSSSSGEDASLRIVGKGRWQFDILGYVQLRNFSNIVISATTLRPTLNQKNTPSMGLGGKIEVRPPIGHGQILKLGADWRQAKAQLYEEAYNATTGALTGLRRAGGRNEDIGLFAEDDAKLGNLVLTAGLRADRWLITQGCFIGQNAAGVTTSGARFAPRSDWALSGRAGAVWNVAQGLALRGSAYTGLRQPTINELYRQFVVTSPNVGGGTTSITTQANAALINERLRGFEAGVDFAPTPAVKLTATAFYNRVDHAIANVTLTATTRQRQNVDAIRAKGVELAAAIKLGQVSLDTSLAWTDAVVLASGPAAALNGLRPAQTPKLAASATLGWKPREGWAISATVRHTGAQYEDDLQSYLLPAATTLSAFAQMPLGQHFSLVLRGENLTNAQVQTRNQAGSIDVDAPRTVWVGVRVKG